MNNDQYLSLRRNVIAFLVAFMIIGGILMILGFLGYANILETRIAGEGTVDHSIYTADKSLSERVIGEGNYKYESKRTWDGDSKNQQFSTKYVITAATGGYQNQYSIQDRAADYGHQWRATKISNNFSATSEVVMTDTTLDSLVIMDGDNATLRGKVITVGKNGRPITEAESVIIGKVAIEQYLNVSKPVETYEDWLALCNKIDELLPDIAVTPVNVTIKKPIPVGGMVVK